MTLSDQEFKDLRLLIQSLCGICLGNDKKYLIQTRLEPLLQRHLISSYADLVRRLNERTQLRLQDEVIECMTTKETSFNRDGHPFEELRRSLLPDLIHSRGTRQRAACLPFGKLKIWSAASSTGQEAYSLGMAILDYVASQSHVAADRFLVSSENFHILGTDISHEALLVARSGKYHARELDRGVSLEERNRYFSVTDGMLEAIPTLRNMADFQRVNLTQPLSVQMGFDLILCRNLLIYFDDATRKSVLDQFVKRLVPGGMLMLGAAESTIVLPQDVAQQQFGKTIIYRKMA